MKHFNELEFKPHVMGDGIQAIIKYPNGYGASVIRTSYSYGGLQGLYELAVLKKNGDICYDTPITDDVCGYLDEDAVTELLNQIYLLKSADGIAAEIE